MTHDGEAVQPGNLPDCPVRPPRCAHWLLGKRQEPPGLRYFLLSTNTSVLPIIIEAGTTKGRLSSLTDRSVARFTTSGTRELLRAAAICGRTVLLAVDGLNECPGLLGKLWPGRDPGCLPPEDPRADVHHIPRRDGPRRPGSCRRARPRPPRHRSPRRPGLIRAADDILPFCDPFTTPYELSIAAAGAAELHGPVTRAALFSSFVRRQLAGTASPAAVRDTLRQLALAMDEQLATWLPLDEVRRTSEEHLARLQAQVGVIDEVLACALVRTSQGKLSFTHELLGRFLVLEALRRDHTAPGLLAEQLQLPGARRPSAAGSRDRDSPLQDLRPPGKPRKCANLCTGSTRRSRPPGAAGRGKGRSAPPSGGYQRPGRHDIHHPKPVRGNHDRRLRAKRGRFRSSQRVGALAREGRFTEEITALLDSTDAACRRSTTYRSARKEGGRHGH